MQIRQEEAIRAACRILGRRWILGVLFAVSNEPLRFSEVHRRLPGMPKRSLGRVLLSLEKQGLITRSVDSSRPPHVSYVLNGDPVLRQMLQSVLKWGEMVLENNA